jgi:hypothetical protein
VLTLRVTARVMLAAAARCAIAACRGERKSAAKRSRCVRRARKIGREKAAAAMPELARARAAKCAPNRVRGAASNAQIAILKSSCVR